MELWLPVKGFPRYEVSSEGRIRNVKTGRIMKLQDNTRGYKQVCLRDESGQHIQRVHRVVADAFYDGDHTGRDVNHIDGNKSNNAVSNLEFCTRSENINHAFQTGLKRPSRQMRIRIIETGVAYDSIRECARAIGGNQSAICKCLTGKEKSCKGYHFEKID